MEPNRPERPRRERRALERQEKKQARGVKSPGTAIGVGLAGIAALAGGGATPADAATFTVTNLNDAGAGSLRQAISDANGAAGADTIDFQAALAGTIVLTTGQLDITDSVMIQGPGPATISVSGNSASRVFYLYNPSSLLDVTISGLTIDSGAAAFGAGIIDFDENLTLDDVTLRNNTASGDGGGLWANGLTLAVNINNSRITGNVAGDDGGGIYINNVGAMTIQGSTIANNTASGRGGGAYFYIPVDLLTIDTTTISGNTAAFPGGGLAFFYGSQGATFTNSTLSGNSGAAGGGMFFYLPLEPLTVENCTISGNQAALGDGGGIYLYTLYAGTSELRHTTIAGNSAPAGNGGGLILVNGSVPMNHMILGDNTAAADPDLSGGNFDLSYSLVEAPGGAVINNIVGNVLNQDPQLAALANNGGPTQTHLPAAASPVVDSGDPAFAPPPATDQRGLARVVGPRIDMGSVELAAPLVPGTIQLTMTTVSVAENVGTVTITATRTGGTDGAVSVTITSADGSAIAPGDYGAIPGGTMLSWADGDGAPKSINVSIVNDTDPEPDETFTVSI
ncbi:MAG TPA: right-handed parallel beta-helix repeat-containing protein, partial [Thermoanaerobaculia bacterium]|nr:right-handed parallel beta-helix repeat-containing protein [Thermoanaerobaculia bacterium]